MKCKNCGANYPSRELACPYCGTANPMGRMQKQQRERAEADYEMASTTTVSQVRRTMCNRVLNRTLLVEGILFALVFLGACATFIFQDFMLDVQKKRHGSEMQAHIEELYEQERFSELFGYMMDYELMGPETYEYSQIALLYYDYQDFVQSRFDYFYELGNLSRYTPESLIRNMHRILHRDEFSAYAELTEKNKVYYEQYVRDVETFAQAVLGFDDAQLDLLRQDYVPIEQEDQLEAVIFARSGTDAD